MRDTGEHFNDAIVFVRIKAGTACDALERDVCERACRACVGVCGRETTYAHARTTLLCRDARASSHMKNGLRDTDRDTLEVH